MKTIPIDEAVEGDIAAQELANADGLVLLPKGMELSASIITRLKKMGVTEVSVEENLEECMAARNKQLTLLEERFDGREDNPYLMEMKAIVIDHLKT